MINFHFVAEVRNMKKHKLCGMISSVFSVENDTGVVDAFHRLADSVQADLSQREGMPKAWYFTITEFKEVGRDDATYRDAVQSEQPQPQMYEHSDGIMREYPEANDIGQRAMDDLTRAVSTGDPLDINIVAELLGIKLDVLEQVAAAESNMQAINEMAEKRKNCNHAWVKVLSTESGFFCRKCSSMEGPEPCERCGNRSTKPDGEHYCHPKQIGDTQAPILNGSDTAAPDERWIDWSGGDTPTAVDGTLVRVKFRNGEKTAAGNWSDWAWQHDANYEWDVVAYMVVEV